MGSPFQEFIEYAFARTRQQLSNYSLSIRPALSGTKYLLGACPAVGIDRGMNPRRRPPLLRRKLSSCPLARNMQPLSIREARKIPSSRLTLRVRISGRALGAQPRNGPFRVPLPPRNFLNAGCVATGSRMIVAISR